MSTPPDPRPTPSIPETAPTPGLLGGRRLDPAAIMLGIGAVVLVGALYVLWTTPRSDPLAADESRFARIEQRVAGLEPLREQAGAATARLQGLTVLEQRVGQLAELEGRLRTVENRPAPPDLRPVQGEVAALAQRLGVTEQDARRAAAINPDQLASRAGLDATTQRLGALEQQISQRIAGMEQAVAQQRTAIDQALAQQRAALEQALAQRVMALEQAVTQRATALEQSLAQRTAALEQQAGQRATALERQIAEGRAALDQQLAQGRAALEQTQARLAALDQRTARFAAIEELQTALAAGQPLGAVLGRLPNAPEPLTRFAAAAPPTEAALRLGFEDAARAARAASDPAMAADGARSGIADAALSRLGGLVTVRRGEQVVWGDAAEAEIEKARRALAAGDLALAVQHLGKLPPPARQAMAGWTGQAEALLAARAALRQLSAG